MRKRVYRAEVCIFSIDVDENGDEFEADPQYEEDFCDFTEYDDALTIAQLVHRQAKVMCDTYKPFWDVMRARADNQKKEEETT